MYRLPLQLPHFAPSLLSVVAQYFAFSRILCEWNLGVFVRNQLPVCEWVCFWTLATWLCLAVAHCPGDCSYVRSQKSGGVGPSSFSPLFKVPLVIVGFSHFQLTIVRIRMPRGRESVLGFGLVSPAQGWDGGSSAPFPGLGPQLLLAAVPHFPCPAPVFGVGILHLLSDLSLFHILMLL